MCPQTPLIKTNSSHAPPPSPPPPSPVPSHSALCGCWASQGSTVIGLDIIYCPLGNVAFQHLIKIISSHSNGRYGLKGTHCNHLDTKRGSCSRSLVPLFSLQSCFSVERQHFKPIYSILHVCKTPCWRFPAFFTTFYCRAFSGSRQSTVTIIVQKRETWLHLFAWLLVIIFLFPVFLVKNRELWGATERLRRKALSEIKVKSKWCDSDLLKVVIIIINFVWGFYGIGGSTAVFASRTFIEP